MLIKQADDKQSLLDELNTLIDHPDVLADIKPRLRDERNRRLAGLKGERDSTYEIDFHFKSNKNWAVIHDLRLEHDGRVAQIDHLLINRFLEILVVETKHYNASVDINDQGEFTLIYGSQRYEGIASPIEQNERHIKVLKDVLPTLKLPKRLGITLRPSFTNIVLLHPKAIIKRSPKFDSQAVIKADQLRTWINKSIDQESLLVTLRGAMNLVSADTVMEVAEQLAACHCPLKPDFRARFGLPAELAPRTAREAALQTLDHAVDKARRDAGLPPDESKAACADCGVALTLAVQQFCRDNTERFEYKLVCMNCQKNYRRVRRADSSTLAEAAVSLASVNSESHSQASEPPAAYVVEPVATAKQPKPAKPRHCDVCGAEVDAKVVAFCRFNKGRFGGKVVCRECQAGAV